MMTETHKLLITIPRELYEQIRQKAFDNRISMAELFRRAILKKLEEEGTLANERNPKKIR